MAIKKQSKKTNQKVDFCTKNKKFILQILVVAGLGALVFFAAQKYRGLILAGTVNTTPITRWQLNQRLAKQYGQQTLEEIVSETLLSQLAKKESVTITEEDINKEIENIKQQVGGQEALDQTLTQYGMTAEDLHSRLSVSLLQQKLAEELFAAEAEVTDEEVKQSYEQNKDFYVSQTLEDVQEEIAKQLKNQKLQQKFSTWFEQQRTEAQITTYL